jgi:hypothetical protein
MCPSRRNTSEERLIGSQNLSIHPSVGMTQLLLLGTHCCETMGHWITEDNDLRHCYATMFLDHISAVIAEGAIMTWDNMQD